MNKIICPVCQNSNKMALQSRPAISLNGKIYIQSKCSCGCVFTNTFELTDTEILIFPKLDNNV